MQRACEVFKAIADETRLRIVNLMLRSSEPLCVCELMDALHLPQYQISRHLSVLKSAHLVTVNREGTWAYHSLETGDSFAVQLWDFLRTVLPTEETEKDLRGLELRLALRSGTKCVIGVVPSDDKPSDHTLGRSKTE